MLGKFVFQESDQQKGAYAMLKTVHRKLGKIPDDAETFVENLCLLRDNFSRLFKKYHACFVQSSLEDRQKLIEAIDELVKQMWIIQDEKISEEDWLTYTEEYGKTIENERKSFEEQLENFRWLCTYDFKHYNESPLKFAQNNVMTLNYINDLEQTLLELMENIDKRLPNGCEPIFVKEREKLRHPRREIVLTCLGGLKSTKSSFINFLLNKSICPTGNAQSTARLTKIQYGNKPSVSLKQHNGTEILAEEFQDIKELHKKLIEIVKLDGKDNRKKGCRDEVIVKLPVNELKGIELWDIPGFDENEEIDEQIKTILGNTDIIFALMPLRETLRRKFEDYVRLGIVKDDGTNDEIQRNKSCESLVCFVITCIDQFCIDEQTKSPREAVLEQLFDQINSTFDINLSRSSEFCSYKNSDRFLPMCTDVRFNVRDHLECREEFIEKSSRWYQVALNQVINLRLHWLQYNTLKILDFYNAEREMDRCDKLTTTIKHVIENVSKQICEMLDQNLEEMKISINKTLESYTMQTVQTLNERDDIKDEYIKCIEKDIISMFKKEYECHLNEIQIKMTTEITQQLANLFQTTELTIQNRQLLMHTLLNANDLDPYKFQNGKYAAVSRMNKEAFKEKIQCSAILGASVGVGYGLFFGILFAVGTAGIGTLALPIFMGAGAAVGSSASTLTIVTAGSTVAFYNYVKGKFRGRSLRKDINNYFNHIMKEYHKIVVQRAHEWLQNMIQDLEKRLIDEVKQRKRFLKHAKQLPQLINILDPLLPQLRKLYLDILDREFCLLYSGKFQIHKNELLGKSNFEVYKESLNENPVAVKILPLNLFNLNEICYFKELIHPNIVQYYGVKKVDDSSYSIVMEYFDFTLLDFLTSRIENNQPFSSVEINDMLRQINSGLLFIHKANIVHRDIKPSNILVKNKMSAAQSIRYAIADFGLAHVEPRSIVGTPGYVAPEIFDRKLGETTNKSDVYSFGVVIEYVLERVGKELRNDVIITKWEAISKECVNKTINLRPTCQQIEDGLSRN